MSAFFLFLELPPWCRDPATCVIAVATVFYVIVTLVLWLSTRKAANAAMISAEAAKKSADATTEATIAAKRSADIAADLHRPVIGISRLYLRSDRSSRTWVIALVLKNYGTLPAVNVSALVEFLLDTSPLWTVKELSSAEVAPHADYEAVNQLDLREKEHNILLEGNKFLVVRIRINYEAADRRRFEYAAEAQLKHITGVFQIVKSETRNL